MALVNTDDDGLALAHPGNAGIVATTRNSKSWTEQQNNATRIFDLFATHLPTRVGKDEAPIPGPFADLGSLMGATHKLIKQEHAISPQMWLLFGEYLVDDYKKGSGRGAGEHLGVNTVNKIFAAAMQPARKLLPHSFFLCLDQHQDIKLCQVRKWFVVARNNMWNKIFTRQVLNGEKIDESATPLTFEHIAGIVRSYSQIASTTNTSGRLAHRRKFSVLSLFQVAGRSGEIATLSYKKLEWDPYFRCVHVEVNKVKTVKTKKVVFAASADRHLCWFTNFGDRLCTEPYTDKDIGEDEVAWLFPDLVDISSPGSRVGEYIRDLAPNGSKTFKEFAVECLPPDVNAAGIRAGCCNILHSTMPECFAITTTGHKLESAAHQTYIDATTANAMPGAVVLGGFPALHWGQRGLCGKSAVAHVPLTTGGFDTIIDELYGITNGTETALSKGGALRPALRATFASQVMHYAARVKAGECNDVHRRLFDALVQTKNAVPGHEGFVVREWGKLLANRFEEDNRHLTLRENAELANQIAAMMQAMETKVETTTNKITELHEIIQRQNGLILSMTVQQMQLMQRFNHLLLRPIEYVEPDPDGDVAEYLNPLDLGPNGPDDDRDGEDRPGKVKGGPRAEPVETIDLSGFDTDPPPPAAPPCALSALMVNRASAELADDKLPNDAWEFLFEEAYSKHNGQVWRPAGQPDKGWTSRKVEANMTLTVLSAMLTKEEKKLMRRRSTAGTRAENSRLAEKAERMTKHFFREWFERDGVDLPNNLRTSMKRDSKGKTMAGASGTSLRLFGDRGGWVWAAGCDGHVCISNLKPWEAV